MKPTEITLALRETSSRISLHLRVLTAVLRVALEWSTSHNKAVADTESKQKPALVCEERRSLTSTTIDGCTD